MKVGDHVVVSRSAEGNYPPKGTRGVVKVAPRIRGGSVGVAFIKWRGHNLNGAIPGRNGWWIDQKYLCKEKFSKLQMSALRYCDKELRK